MARARLSRKFDKGANPSNDVPPCETCPRVTGFISSKRHTSIKSPERLQSQFPGSDENGDQARPTQEAPTAEGWRSAGWDQVVLMAWSSHTFQGTSPGLPGQHGDDFSMKVLQRQLDSNYRSE